MREKGTFKLVCPFFNQNFQEGAMGLAGFNRARRDKWNKDKARALAEKEEQQKEEAEENEKNSARYDRIQALGEKTVPKLKELIQEFPDGLISLPPGPKKADLINAIINAEFQPGAEAEPDDGVDTGADEEKVDSDAGDGAEAESDDTESGAEVSDEAVEEAPVDETPDETPLEGAVEEDTESEKTPEEIHQQERGSVALDQ